MSKQRETSSTQHPMDGETKVQILGIKINYFKPWIQDKLTDLLEGLEDEILWSLVYNYLEDAHRKAKREGPAANPSGGLSATEITTALTGFLGEKQAIAFVSEMFLLLKKAEANGGIPPEFEIKPEVAEKEAYSIINEKRKEMDMSDRVRREIKRNDHYNNSSRRHDRDYSDRRTDERYKDDRKYDEDRRRDDYKRYDDYRRYDDDGRRDRVRRYDDDRRFDNDRRGRESQYHDHDGKSNYNDERETRRDRKTSRSQSPRNEYSHRSSSRTYHERGDRDKRSHEGYRSDRENESGYRYRRHRSEVTDRSPIKSSSPESANETWEASVPLVETLPRAPNVQEKVSSELEQALRAKALQSLAISKK